jgi:hypothetical protein
MINSEARSLLNKSFIACITRRVLRLLLELVNTLFNPLSLSLKLLQVLLQFSDNFFLAYEAPPYKLAMSMMCPASMMTAATTIAPTTVVHPAFARVAVMPPPFSMSVAMLPATALSLMMHFCSLLNIF